MSQPLTPQPRRPQLINSQPTAHRPTIDGILSAPRPRPAAVKPAAPPAPVTHLEHVTPVPAHPPRSNATRPVRPDIIGKPRPTATQAAATTGRRQAMPHLQPHPMLRRPATDIQPPTRQHATQPAPVQPQPARQQVRGHDEIAKDLAHRSPLDKASSRLSGMHIGKTAAIGLVMAALLVGLSLFSLQLGEIVLAIYAIAAIWKRLPSRLSFSLALATFGGIIVTQLVSPDSGIADNLAVYAFLLLCIGTISLAREVRQSDRPHSQRNGGSLSKSL